MFTGTNDQVFRKPGFELLHTANVCNALHTQLYCTPNRFHTFILKWHL